MEPQHTIVFTCACSHVLEAPIEWKGRRVSCLLCRATLTVPETNDPVAVRRDQELAVRLAQAQRREAAARMPPAALPAPLVEPVPDTRVAMPAAPAAPSASSRWAIAAVVVIVPIALAAAIVVYRASPGSGLAKPQQPSPAASAEASEVNELRQAEQAYHKSGQGLAQAERLSALYRRVSGMQLRPRSRAYYCNNAAWFFATTPHLGLRDPEQALSLARIAVDLTAGKDPNLLDTLAEALFVNRRYAEAVEKQTQVLGMMPDAGADFHERFDKYQQALAASSATPAASSPRRP